MGKDSVILFSKALEKLRGFPVPHNVIDWIYRSGDISKEEYKKFYEDSSGTYIPKLTSVELEFPKDIHDMCDREQDIQDKNLALYESQELQKLFE